MEEAPLFMSSFFFPESDCVDLLPQNEVYFLFYRIIFGEMTGPGLIGNVLVSLRAPLPGGMLLMLLPRTLRMPNETRYYDSLRILIMLPAQALRIPLSPTTSEL